MQKKSIKNRQKMYKKKTKIGYKRLT